MRVCDLSAGTAKLGLAMESLRKATAEAAAHWDDQTSRRFQEAYLTPLDPTVRKTLDALHRLTETLANAERECGTY